MKNQTTLLLAVCLICFLFYRCTAGPASATTTGDSTIQAATIYGGYASEAEWGSHLVLISGCNDCHTPKKMTDKGPVDDTSLMLSGYASQAPVPGLMPDQVSKGLAATYDLTAWHGPWGKSYAANLTPDSTGIGGWSEQQFLTCIRQGVFKGIEGSRPIMPPMPIPSLQNMTDNELKAIFTFLKTIKPVHNVVPDYQPPVH